MSVGRRRKRAVPTVGRERGPGRSCDLWCPGRGHGRERARTCALSAGEWRANAPSPPGGVSRGT
eukprot:3592402-Alexandrium_andersonii.AAC.1